MSSGMDVDANEAKLKRDPNFFLKNDDWGFCIRHFMGKKQKWQNNPFVTTVYIHAKDCKPFSE